MENSHRCVLHHGQITDRVQLVVEDLLRHGVLDPDERDVRLLLGRARGLQLLEVAFVRHLHLEGLDFVAFIRDRAHFVKSLVASDALARINELKNERPSITEHPHINVFSSAAVQIYLICTENLTLDLLADELLDALYIAVASDRCDIRPIVLHTLLYASTATVRDQVPRRLAHVSRQLDVPALDEEGVCLTSVGQNRRQVRQLFLLLEDGEKFDERQGHRLDFLVKGFDSEGFYRLILALSGGAFFLLTLVAPLGTTIALLFFIRIGDFFRQSEQKLLLAQRADAFLTIVALSTAALSLEDAVYEKTALKIGWHAEFSRQDR